MTQHRAAKILIVDDNPNVRSFLRPALETAGFQCIEAADGWDALESVEQDAPNLIVLDIMLGDSRINGLDVCKRLREKGINTPIIFLTVKDRAEDLYYLERAFALGGDDYVSKREELLRLEQHTGLGSTEFLFQKSDVEELLSRIKIRLGHAPSKHEFDNFLRIDLAGHRVDVKRMGAWQQTHVTPTEFSILEALLRRRGRPVGKASLMDIADIDGEGSLQNHIWRLRHKIEPDPKNPRYVLTYHGIGYRFGRLS